MKNYSTPPPEQRIFDHFEVCLRNVIDNRQCYVSDPVSDFTRTRKLPMDSTMRLVIQMSGLDNTAEIHSFFDCEDPPTGSALVQQRKKLLPSAFSAVFRRLHLPFENCFRKQDPRIRLGAIDGCDIRFPASQKYHEFLVHTSSEEMQGRIQMISLYDLDNRLFLEEELAFGNGKSEVALAEKLVESGSIPEDMAVLFDRGFESFELMECFRRHSRFFVIRIRDIGHRGILRGPQDQEEFDYVMKVHLSWKSSKEAKEDPYYRYLSNNSDFKYLERWSEDYYEMNIRVLRIAVNIPGQDKTLYTCFATNLDSEQFPSEWFSRNYALRWGHEKGFYQLKHPIHMIRFNSKNPILVLQELYAAMIVHNLASLICLLVKPHFTGRYQWHPDFSTAVINVRRCLRKEITPGILLLRTEKCLTPNRPGRAGSPRKDLRCGPQPFNGR